MNYKELADEIDLLIRSGNSSLAAQSLKGLDRTKIPRSHRARFGSLFLRTGQADSCIRLLNRIVRRQDSFKGESSSEEKLYYGAALIACGASLEGINLLSTPEMAELPETHLYLTIGHFTRWEYHAAIPLIQKFIDHPLSSDYQKIVGKLNLASALIVVGRSSEAQDILTGMLQIIGEKSEFQLIRGNAYELLTQTAIKSQQFDLASSFIRTARNLQSNHSGTSSLFLSKWEAVCKALNPKNREQGIMDLHRVAREAAKLRHWETLRETHFYLARILEDFYSFQRVYFGTPFHYYRQRMVNDFQVKGTSMPNHFIYYMGGYDNCYPIVYDTLTGRIEGTNEGVSFATLPYKLLNLLTSDLFRPFRVSKIFSELYPNDFFDPFSSPHRVHENINRLRKVLVEKNIPLSVIQRGGDYTLVSTAPIGLRVFKKAALGGRSQLYMRKFLNNWDRTQKFNRSQVAKSLDLSLRETSRILRAATDNGEISCQKVGREKLYKVA